MASSKPLSIHQLSTYPLPSAGSDLSKKRIVFDKLEYQKDVKESKRKSWWASSISRFIGVFRVVRQRVGDHRALVYLKSLDDCYLNDIGINRADIVMALRMENSSLSASAVLQKIALEKRKQDIKKVKE